MAITGLNVGGTCGRSKLFVEIISGSGTIPTELRDEFNNEMSDYLDAEYDGLSTHNIPLSGWDSI